MFKFHYRHHYEKEYVEKTHLDRELIFRLLYYFKPYRWKLIASLILLVSSRLIDAAVPFFLGNLVRTIFDQKSWPALESGIQFVVFLLISSYALEAIHVVLRSRAGQEAIYTLRQDVFSRILYFPVRYFENNPVGRLLTRAVNDVDQINQMFTEGVVPILGSMFLFIAIAFFMLFQNPFLFAVFFSIFPFVLGFTEYFRRKQRACYTKVRAILSAMNAFVEEHLAGVFIIQRFSIEDREKKKFDEINEDHCTAYQESIQNFSLFIAAIDFMQSVMIIILFMTLHGNHFDAGTFFSFSLYTVMLFRPMIDLLERYNLLQATFVSAERLFSLLDEKLEKNGKETCGEITSLEFRDVWHAYEKDNWVLKGINFTLKKGDILGIVGISGSGKSTLISLLLGFISPKKGEIFINGKEIRSFKKQSLRKQISTVLQESAFFEGTLFENLTFDTHVSKKYVETLLQGSCFRELYQRFPDGLKHKVSERGKEFSLGEMQLLALFRAMIRNAPLFLFDEPTAHIDIKTESKIEAALEKTLENKAAILIAHRLKTIRFAKTIAVLHEGSLVEMGSHEELIKKGGYYARLVQSLEPAGSL